MAYVNYPLFVCTLAIIFQTHSFFDTPQYECTRSTKFLQYKADPISREICISERPKDESTRSKFTKVVSALIEFSNFRCD
jgi:hypothetical protein